MTRLLAALCALTVLAPLAWADTYDPITTYSVTCLDYRTGTHVWTTPPFKMYKPTLSFQDDVIILASGVNDNETTKSWIEYASGRVLTKKPDLPGRRTVAALLPITPRLRTSNGTSFEFSEGHAHSLIFRTSGTRQVVPMGGYLLSLTGTDGGAFFTVSGTTKLRAYDYRRDKMLWEYDWRTMVPKPAVFDETTIAIDGPRVLLGVDQAVFCLDIDNGRLAWMTQLPKQIIRPFDQPWKTFYSLESTILVRSYDCLVALRAADGGLLWSHDCGIRSRAEPLVVDNRVFICTRPRLALPLPTDVGKKQPAS